MYIALSILVIVLSVLLVGKNAMLYTNGGTGVKWCVFVTNLIAMVCGGFGIACLLP